ncbi:maleate cis-trans isomerase family protein [Streptomyces hirsutus]|uniref:maleate cis-trans isomerase family protein n=1 Tax=Streptomyces hirsutus TaxID=35620 RepID=UPI0006E36E37|nr:aspartate/glutamate racemase family protein [Streptomyces hirsutus]
MDVSFLGGPGPQRGVGVVAPFDFALDRELWRWTPDDVSLHVTRTPYVPVEVSLDLARVISEHETLRDAVSTLTEVTPEVVAYACTSGSFVGGVMGEHAMCEAMSRAGSVPAVTTSGALLEALVELDVRRLALVTPYTVSVTRALEEYVAQAGVTVTGCAYMSLTRQIWKVTYREVVDMARRAAVRGRLGAADALFLSCTNLPTYDVIPQLEAELRIPVISANQVTMWAALRRLGTWAVGPYQALIDTSARTGTGTGTGIGTGIGIGTGSALPAAGPVVPTGSVLPEGQEPPDVRGAHGVSDAQGVPGAQGVSGVPDEKQQEGWT